MSQTDDSSLQEHTNARLRRPSGLKFTITALTAILLSAVAVDPVVAQQPLQSSVCDAENLPA